MRGTFSIIETVRIQYTYQTNDEQEALIDSLGSFEKYVESIGAQMLWSGTDGNFEYPEHNQILDYLEMSCETFWEE